MGASKEATATARPAPSLGMGASSDVCRVCRHHTPVPAKRPDPLPGPRHRCEWEHPAVAQTFAGTEDMGSPRTGKGRTGKPSNRNHHNRSTSKRRNVASVHPHCRLQRKVQAEVHAGPRGPAQRPAATAAGLRAGRGGRALRLPPSRWVGTQPNRRALAGELADGGPRGTTGQAEGQATQRHPLIGGSQRHAKGRASRSLRAGGLTHERTHSR